MHEINAVENILTKSEYSINMDMLCIPVMTHLELLKGLSIGIGIQPSLLLSAKQRAQESGYFYVDEDGAAYLSRFPLHKEYLEKGASSDISGRCRFLGLEFPVGIAYEYQKVKADLRYCFGLFNAIHDNETQPRCLMLTLGYNFFL